MRKKKRGWKTGFVLLFLTTISRRAWNFSMSSYLIDTSAEKLYLWVDIIFLVFIFVAGTLTVGFLLRRDQSLASLPKKETPIHKKRG